MILTILLTFLFALIRGYSLKNLIKEKTLYPFFIFEIVLIAVSYTHLLGQIIFKSGILNL